MPAADQHLPRVTDQRGQDRGSITVEGAIALCSLMLVFATVLTGVTVVLDQLRCTDAAGAAARLFARGQKRRAEEVVRMLAPADAELAVDRKDRTVTVTVSARPAGGLLPGVTVRARAHAELEPGVRFMAGYAIT